MPRRDGLSRAEPGVCRQTACRTPSSFSALPSLSRGSVLSEPGTYPSQPSPGVTHRETRRDSSPCRLSDRLQRIGPLRTGRRVPLLQRGLVVLQVHVCAPAAVSMCVCDVMGETATAADDIVAPGETRSRVPLGRHLERSLRRYAVCRLVSGRLRSFRPVRTRLAPHYRAVNASLERPTCH